MVRRGGRGIWKACVLGDDAPCGFRAALSPGQEENSPGESSQSIPASPQGGGHARGSHGNRAGGGNARGSRRRKGMRALEAALLIAQKRPSQRTGEI